VAREGQRLGIAFRSQRARGCVDREESAIEIAVGHARQVELHEVIRERVAIAEIPARPFEIDRRVEVRVEDQQAPVDRHRIIRGGLLGRLRARRHRKQRSSGKKSHHSESPAGLRSRSW
jgi:hypothetical protein